MYCVSIVRIVALRQCGGITDKIQRIVFGRPDCVVKTVGTSSDKIQRILFR